MRSIRFAIHARAARRSHANFLSKVEEHVRIEDAQLFLENHVGGSLDPALLRRPLLGAQLPSRSTSSSGLRASVERSCRAPRVGGLR